MKIGELKELLSNISDDVEIEFFVGIQGKDFRTFARRCSFINVEASFSGSDYDKAKMFLAKKIIEPLPECE